MSAAGDHYFTPSPEAPAQRRPLTVSLAGRPRSLRTAAGVFSADRLDAGTRVLLGAVPAPPAQGNLVDLGCGWGPVTLSMALASPRARVWAIDVNTRALELTAANASSLGLDNVTATTPEQVADDLVVDALWSNPPVHVGKAVLHEMLATWLPRLRPGGDAAAHLVVHRHLGSDSLARWISEQRFATPGAAPEGGAGAGGGGADGTGFEGAAIRASVERLTSVDGYRVLKVTCGPA